MIHKVALFMVLALMGSTTVLGQESILNDFKIEDQFGEIHSDKDYINKVVIMIASDKDGSQFNGLWGAAIHDSLRKHTKYSRVAFLALADVRGVPFFLKEFVKGKFPKDRDKWVLMDWKGSFAKAYKFEPESTNILVFAPGGKLLHRVYGREVEVDVLRGIVARVLDVLDGHS